VLDRELTYQIPFELLVKLSRFAGRKAFSTSWYLRWLLLGCYFAMLGALYFFDAVIARLETEAGIPRWVWMVLMFAVLVIGVIGVRRHTFSKMKSRADFDSTVTLQQEPGGLRFATSQIEYYVKWNGISQMLKQHDGVAIAQGSLFFLIPDTAFADTSERDRFVLDVFGRLNDAAREQSEALVRPLRGALSTTART
jgi:hypothetical protein